MKKYIFIMNVINVMDRLVSSKNKRVEGVLYLDQETGKLTFKAYNRVAPKYRPKDRLIAKLPWGWLKESMKCIKVHGSFDKELGTARIMAELDRHTRMAKDALIDRELTEFC